MQVKAMTLTASLLPLSWDHEKQNIRLGGWKKDGYRKTKIFFVSILAIVKKNCNFSLPCFIIPFKLGAWKRDRILECVWGRVTERTPPNRRNSFACFPAVISLQILSSNVIFFIIFTNPSARVGYDTMSIFKQSLTGLNSEFSFS